MLDRKKLARAYFTKNKIVQHQIDSFNEFIDHGLQKVVDEMGVIETEVGDASSGTKTYVRLETLSVGHPVVKEADGAVDRLFPSDARLRNLTYSAPINLAMTVVQDGVESDPKSVEIGVTPIMLRSKACNLYGLTDAEIQSHGEDPLDPGGYFITNGTERVIMTLEDLAPNKIMTEIDHSLDLPASRMDTICPTASDAGPLPRNAAAFSTMAILPSAGGTTRISDRCGRATAQHLCARQPSFQSQAGKRCAV
jgi:DNA-directed RNA polymerase subunit B"